MKKYNFFKLLLTFCVIIFAIFFFLGCENDQNNAMQNENNTKIIEENTSNGDNNEDMVNETEICIYENNEDMVDETEMCICENKHGELIEIITSESELETQGIFICENCNKNYFNYITYSDLGLPILKFSGSLNGISKDNKVQISVSYDAGEKLNFSCDATLKLQGASSINYPQKNFNIQFYKKDTNYEKKYKVELFSGCGKESKYTLKANWIDFSQSRNVVAGKLYNQIVHTGELNDEITALANGGVVDGYPIVIFENGNFLGLYTLNIAKDNLFGMEESETKQAVLMASSWENVYLRNEINLNDGNWELEFCSTEDIDEIGTDWVLDSFNSFINFINTSTDDEFRNNAHNYISLEHSIDCLLYTQLLCASDNTAKNIIYVTYDGTKWIETMYDMDGTFGLIWHGNDYYDVNFELQLQNKNKLWERIYNCFYDEIVNRYTELRNGPISIENIDSLFTDFFNTIPSTVYEAELKKWKTNPNPEANTLSQIVNWTYNRIKLLDELYNITVEETSPLKISFNLDEHSKVIVYRSQNKNVYGDKTNTTFARNSETGKLSFIESGECCFTVLLEEDYELDGNIQITGNYDNVTITAENNIISYRVTNITENLTISINTKHN